MTLIGRRCRDGNVYSRAVLIARTLSLKPTGFERKDKRHTAKKTAKSGQESQPEMSRSTTLPAKAVAEVSARVRGLRSEKT